MKIKLPDTATVFGRSVELIVNILIIYTIVILLIGLVQTIAGIKVLLAAASFSEGFTLVVSDLLTFMVIIELFKGFVDFFKAKRFSLHNLLDPAILFVIRELIVALYREHYDWATMLGFSALILTMGVCRTLAIRFSPECRTLPDD